MSITRGFHCVKHDSTTSTADAPWVGFDGSLFHHPSLGFQIQALELFEPGSAEKYFNKFWYVSSGFSSIRFLDTTNCPL